MGHPDLGAAGLDDGDLLDGLLGDEFVADEGGGGGGALGGLVGVLRA